MQSAARPYCSRCIVFADVRSYVFLLMQYYVYFFKNKGENKKQCGYGFTKVVKLQARQYMYVIAELRINGSGTVLV